MLVVPSSPRMTGASLATSGGGGWGSSDAGAGGAGRSDQRGAPGGKGSSS